MSIYYDPPPCNVEVHRCHKGEMEMEVKVFTLKELTFYWILPNTKMAYY